MVIKGMSRETGIWGLVPLGELIFWGVINGHIWVNGLDNLKWKGF